MTSDSEPATPPTSVPEHAYATGHLANVAAAVHELKHPTQIGPYRILSLIGEGGMGTVYRAEQREPIQRTVALKIVKLGMDTRQVIARFESERQALALMNHPNVAKVLDAGATETGRPYFAMEFVPGEPITRFADQRQLSVRQRLELFMQACAAVQHAHQKGIIHRDLKPSNMLVMAQDYGAPGLVKVIDFGVAKALSQRLTEKTLLTDTGQLVGTPEYMAPEQADPSLAMDADTRSDVYSLGVVLYELLSGVLPFDARTLRSAGYQEIQRIIRDVDPPRPSTRLSSLGGAAQEVARRRQTPLDSLWRQLRSELEWIPLKAMSKEADHRYASPLELSEDIANYLANRPLRAGPVSRAYRARKFLRRNKAVVCASAGMLLLLVAGITATTWQAYRATRAERATRRALEEVQLRKKEVENANRSVSAVNEFLTQEMLVASTPEVTRGRPMTVLEALDNAARRIKGHFDETPATEASVRSTVSRAYQALGRTDLALPQARAAVEVCRRWLPETHNVTVASLNQLAQVLENEGNYSESETIYRDGLERARRAGGPQSQNALVIMANLARLMQKQGRFTEAEPLSRQAAEGLRALVGDDDDSSIGSAETLGMILEQQNRLAESESIQRQVLSARLRVDGDDHPDTLTAMSNLASVLLRQGKPAEAEQVLQDALPRARRVLGEENLLTISCVSNLATAQQKLGKLPEAEGLLRESLETSRHALGDDHPATLSVMNNLGALLRNRGKIDEAIQLYRQALPRFRSALGDEHPNTLMLMNNLAQALSVQGRAAEAEPLFAEVYRRVPDSQIDAKTAAVIMSRWGPSLVELARYAQAEQPLLEAHQRLTVTGQSNSAAMVNVLNALAKVCDQTARPDEAARWRQQLAAIHPATRLAPAPPTAPKN
jgi:serine/threonine protein kinase